MGKSVYTPPLNDLNRMSAERLRGNVTSMIPLIEPKDEVLFGELLKTALIAPLIVCTRPEPDRSFKSTEPLMPSTSKSPATFFEIMLPETVLRRRRACR